MATYIVQEGDSLSKIARDVLGDLSRWPEISALNALDDPNFIYPGQVLELPSPSPAASAGATDSAGPLEITVTRPGGIAANGVAGSLRRNWLSIAAVAAAGVGLWLLTRDKPRGRRRR